MNNNDFINVTDFPDSFQRLYRIFSQINTHLTFLGSHSRSTIPTFDLIHKLNNDITKLDLTIIKHLFPEREIYFDYIDENQVMLSFLEKVEHNKIDGYKSNNPSTVDDEYEKIAKQSKEIMHSKQLLIFDFQDTRIDSAGPVVMGRKRKREDNNASGEFFLSSKELSTEPLTQQQLMGIIKSRNEKFKKILKKYLEKLDYGNIDFELFESSYKSKVPREPGFVNPVEESPRKSAKVNGSTHTSGVEKMISTLKQESFYKNQITSIQTLNPTKAANYVNFENHDLIHPELKAAVMAYKGISIEEGLYSHQVEALSSLITRNDGSDHVIISTSTASGKSLIFQLPILNDILWNITRGNKGRGTTAFFIFPTKALAQDQKRHIEELISHIPTNNERRIIVETYDGDTPYKERKSIRSFADIIFTNPDTIHASILPNFVDKDWNTFLKALKYVVLDELHVYKGTFGVHVSYVMSRLLRVRSISNTDSKKLNFIACSATISDPMTHFRTICRIPKTEGVVHVSEDGSPCAEKKLLVWRPPPLMNKRGQTPVFGENEEIQPFIPRVNIMPESASILVQLLSKLPDVRIILFCPIRAMCELVMKEVRTLIKTSYSRNLTETDVMSYRGGYSKRDRRIIEQKMFSGELRAIVATNALELGVDLSYLDVVITCGFPLSKSNMHQQFGRAGRGKRSEGSLAIYVSSGSPVDQYYLEHPEELCNKGSYEDLCVESLSNLSSSNFILEQHLQCASYEEPIDVDNDAKWFIPEGTNDANNIFSDLCKSKLIQDFNGLYTINPIYLPRPTEMVSIRAIENETFAVVDITKDRNVVIEEVESSRTSFTLYEGGIFLHQGLPYLVKEFNADQKFAKVERVNVDWITQQRDFKDVDPLEIEYVKELYSSDISASSDVPLFYGKVQLTLVVFGFFKVNRKGEIIEAVEVTNPPVILRSRGLWVDIPQPALKFIKEKEFSVAGGIHAAQHAVMNMFPLFLNSNGGTDIPLNHYSNIGETELHTECKAPEKEFASRETRRKRPARLIFFDAKGGERGSGMSAKVFEYFDDLLFTTYHRVKACDCLWGCPQCVAPQHCSEMSEVMSKPAAMIILASLLGLNLDEEFRDLPDGPEPNMQAIKVETIDFKRSTVRFSPDVRIVKIRKARSPLPDVKVKQEEDNS
ncbi:hypothetical protein DFJ63DRAFT_287328 [Scheffersomyces coipomensis]|uniref:uncharacterized protein n=1 Tax=Scheffersomyces coipomensis TaxID=1788519 RepID=UPI00315CC773